MIRSEAISIIKRGLGFRQTQDSSIVAALKQAQRDLEQGNTLPEWLVEYNELIHYDGTDAAIELPSRFLRLHEDYPTLLYANATTGEQGTVVRRNATEAFETYPPMALAAGYPQVFILRATQIVLLPYTSTPVDFYLTYYRAADVLDSDIENAWLANAANYIIGVAGTQVAGDLRDAGAMQKFNTMAQLGYKSYIGSIVDTELAGRALVMGRNN